jgi:hypothetical protein
MAFVTRFHLGLRPEGTAEAASGAFYCHGSPLLSTLAGKPEVMSAVQVFRNQPEQSTTKTGTWEQLSPLQLLCICLLAGQPGASLSRVLQNGRTGARVFTLPGLFYIYFTELCRSSRSA